MLCEPESQWLGSKGSTGAQSPMIFHAGPNSPRARARALSASAADNMSIGVDQPFWASSFLTALTPGTPRVKSEARARVLWSGTLPIRVTTLLSERTLMSVSLRYSSLSRRPFTAFSIPSSFASTDFRCSSGTTCRALLTDVAPLMPLATSSAAVRSSALATLPRSVTIPLCVSTLMCRAFTRLSVTSAVFAFVVSQESFIICPAPSPAGLVGSPAFSALRASPGVDCASDIAGDSATATTVRTQSTSFIAWAPLICSDYVLHVARAVPYAPTPKTLQYLTISRSRGGQSGNAMRHGQRARLATANVATADEAQVIAEMRLQAARPVALPRLLPLG